MAHRARYGRAHVLRARLPPARSPPSPAPPSPTRTSALRSADGTRFAAFAAAARTRRTAAGIVVLPDVRGLYALLRGAGAALRRARLRGRRDRLLRPHRGRGEARRRLRLLAEHVDADHAASGIRRRRRRRGRAPARAGARSACSRSASASAAAMRGWPPPTATGWRARSASTGGPGVRNGQPGPVQRAGEHRGAAARADGRRRPGRSAPTRSRRSRRALREAGVEHEVVTYPGAPHSFFDRKQEEFADGVRGRLAAHARLHRAPRVTDQRAQAPPRERRCTGAMQTCARCSVAGSSSAALAGAALLLGPAPTALGDGSPRHGARSPTSSATPARSFDRGRRAPRDRAWILAGDRDGAARRRSA